MDGRNNNPKPHDGPLFTVLVATHNRLATLGATIESVLAQRFADFELVVVNDGSTDGTRELLDSYGDRLRVIHQDNAFLGAARNAGLAVARGRYVALLDDDDLWLPWTLDTYRRALRRHNDPPCMVGRMERFIDPTQVEPWREEALVTREYDDYLAACGDDPHVYSATNVIRTDVLRAIGGWDEARVAVMDQDAWLRMDERQRFVRIEQPVTLAVRVDNEKIGGNPRLLYDGASVLLDREYGGRYPGGRRRRRQRMIPICDVARGATWVAIGHGRSDFVWSLYRRTVRWQARLGRWKYVLGTPVLTLGRALRRGRK